ncbi:MAG: sigma-70 family RNA polymerase sigma factor [Planctomycetes bacterium]|nr:sigma-70 family RNA polymerase sigma factor [Planctomycetota bacterium]
MAAVFLGRENNARTLQPTALVHEAFLRVIGVDGTSAAGLSKADFFARAANCMRLVLIDHARRKKAIKRTAPGRTAPGRADVPGLVSGGAVESGFDVLEIEEALEKLARLDPRAVESVRLRFYMGLTTTETAEVMGVSESTVEKDWRVARAWLKRWLGSDEAGDRLVEG